MDNPRPFGIVHGLIYAGVGDSADAGRAPDLLGVNGTATFSATVERDIINTPGAEMIILPQNIDAQVKDGHLQWLNADDVPITANLDASGKSLGWQWKVDFDLRDAANKKYTLTGWRLDVKIYDAAAPLVNGVNPTITQLTSQAPVSGPNVTVLAKGDPGGIVDLSIGSVTTTTNPANAAAAIVPTADPLKKKLDLTLPIGSGSGGGSGTVTKVNDVAPDSSGAIVLTPGDIGAASTSALSTVSTTAGQAKDTADQAKEDIAAAMAALLNKADLASPTFTGLPKAPTQAATDATKAIATTEFVQGLIAILKTLLAGGSIGFAVWNPTTKSWGVRPNAVLVFGLSTMDVTATKPSWMLPGQNAGDIWVPHPDAVVP